jgi:LPS export ABC transporter protein LptC
MYKSRRAVLATAIVLSLFGVAYKVYDSIQSAKQEIRKNPLKALDYLPESALHMRDFHRSKIEEGRKVWEIFGDDASFYKEQKEAVIKKPRFIYYDKKGEAAQAVGNVARLFFNEKELQKMEMQGNIEVTYNGYILKSEEAVYLPEKQRIFLPSKTTIASEGIASEGSSMEVELDDKKVRLLNNVKTKIEPEKLETKKKANTQASQAGKG